MDSLLVMMMLATFNNFSEFQHTVVDDNTVFHVVHLEDGNRLMIEETFDPYSISFVADQYDEDTFIFRGYWTDYTEYVIEVGVNGHYDSPVLHALLAQKNNVNEP